MEEAKRRNTLILCAVPPGAHNDSSSPIGSLSPRSSPSPPTPRPPPIAGFALCRLTGLNTHLAKLVVVPELRRRGIGRALVEAAVADTRRRRGGCLSLHVAQDNSPAVGLYRGVGFVEEGVLQDYYSVGKHALKMRLDLSQGP